VAAKIILLGDVIIRTILYAVLVVGASDRLMHTRSFAPMRSSRLLAALAPIVLADLAQKKVRVPCFAKHTS
jgi:hypothetical protein